MTSIEELWAEDDLPDPNDGGGSVDKIQPGEYNGTVESMAIQPHKHFDGVTELAFGITMDDGPTVHGGIETSPFKTKDGEHSPGKVKFAKWQIKSVLGYKGSLADLPSVAQSYVGKRVRFRLKAAPSGYLEPAFLELLSPMGGGSDVVDEITAAFGPDTSDVSI
jgi:hypothetical protein